MLKIDKNVYSFLILEAVLLKNWSLSVDTKCHLVQTRLSLFLHLTLTASFT